MRIETDRLCWRIGAIGLVHLFALVGRLWDQRHRGRERYFFPDLPDIEPPEYRPVITEEEVEFAEQLVAQEFIGITGRCKNIIYTQLTKRESNCREDLYEINQTGWRTGSEQPAACNEQ